MEQPIGNYIEIMTARSTDPEILAGCQDGGIVSTAYVFGLENGLLDGAIVAETGPGHTPVPKVAKTRADVLAAGKTKYSVSPNVSMLKTAVRENALEKVGFVGTPCQIQAVRKLIQYPAGFRHVTGKIGIVIGIFCMENFPSFAMKTLIEQYAGIPAGAVLKTDITKGKLFVYNRDGSEPVAIPLKETHIFEQKSCHVCMDYTSELADFSTGSVGSPAGWSTLIVRTQKGKEYVDAMIKAGMIETKPFDMEGQFGYPMLEKLAVDKKTKNAKTIEARLADGLPVPQN